MIGSRAIEEGGISGTYEVAVHGLSDIAYGMQDTGGGGSSTSGTSGTVVAVAKAAPGIISSISKLFGGGKKTVKGVPDAMQGLPHIADQEASFTLARATTVIYGRPDGSTSKFLQPGTYRCSNSFFGDPRKGADKGCYADPSALAGASPRPTLPNIGYGVQNQTPTGTVEVAANPMALPVTARGQPPTVVASAGLFSGPVLFAFGGVALLGILALALRPRPAPYPLPSPRYARSPELAGAPTRRRRRRRARGRR